MSVILCQPTERTLSPIPRQRRLYLPFPSFMSISLISSHSSVFAFAVVFTYSKLISSTTTRPTVNLRLIFSHEQSIMVFYSVQAISLCRILRLDQLFWCSLVSLDAVLPPKRNCRRTLLCMVSCSGIKAQSSFPTGLILRPTETNCSPMALGMHRQAALVKKRSKRDAVEKEKR